MNKTDTKLIIEEIKSYRKSLDFVISNLPDSKSLFVFTLERTAKFSIALTDGIIDKALFDFNEYLKYLEGEFPNVKVLNINTFYEKYSLQNRIDWKYYFISQMELNPAYLNVFEEWMNNQVRSIELKRKKCIVLDLDNTLWGGVLGEDGISGIQIGNSYPGNAFLFFQQALLELKNSGVILSVCSKNNESDVLELWDNHSDILLRKKDFICTRINWNDKADNIIEIANELNIGLDSLVFIDDNPIEREFVKKTLPEVVVPEFPAEPYLIPQFFNELVEKYFAVYNLTKEDLTKSLQYESNIRRGEFLKSFNDKEKFISELDIVLTIEELDDSNVSRFSQMTQKTNQFNLTTKRYTDIEINSFKNSGLIYGLRVKDKFGDNGITGLIMIGINQKKAIIDTYLFSCRVLGRNIEFEFMKYILLNLKKKNIESVSATYLKTSKNEQAELFYEKLNFQLITSTENKKEYLLELNKVNYELMPNTYKFL